MAALDARRTERLSAAVITIQRTTRSFLIRRRFLAMANLAVALQTLCRGLFLDSACFFLMCVYIIMELCFTLILVLFLIRKACF